MFVAVGAIVLAFTGAEALYANMVLATVRKRTKMAVKRVFWTAGWKVA